MEYRTVEVFHGEMRALKDSGVDEQTVSSGRQFQSGTVRWKKSSSGSQ